MITITALDPDTNLKKTISVNLEASMIVQDLDGDLDFFVTLSTSAKDVSGNAIPKYSIAALSEGAGGAGVDRKGVPLAGGKYAGLTDAINDYVAMMVEGVNGEPGTAMAFN